MTSSIRDTDLTEEIADLIRETYSENLPVTLRVSKIGDRTSGVLRVTEDGRERARTISSHVFGLLSESKRTMARPGSGTWITFEMEITSDGRAATRCDYGAPILWGPTGGPGADAYRLELERYPRDPDRIPAWWQNILDEPSVAWVPSREWLDEMDARFAGA
ncbi:MAG TPA: hypothetical protein VGN37_04700 [Actinocatenispora sp.]